MDRLPSSNIMSVRDLRQHFQFSPRNSIKSMLTAMYASIGGWSMPDANTVVLHSKVVAGGLDSFDASVDITFKRDGTCTFSWPRSR